MRIVRINPKERSNKIEKPDLKELIANTDQFASLSYKLAAGIGALVTFLYLLSIQFFPSALTPGEVIFFLFVAFAFGFIYIVFTLYSAFSMIWLVWGVSWVGGKLKGKPLRVTQSKLHKLLSDHVWVSALVFVVFLVTALLTQSSKLIRIVVVVFLVGWIVLSLALAMTASSNPRPASKWPRWAGWLMLAVLPFGVVCFLIGPSFFTNMTFAGIGVRSMNVSVELAESEIGPINRAQELLGRPLIDCQKSGSDKLLVHGVNVLWGGIGDKTLIELLVSGPEEPWYHFSDAKPLKSITIPFEAKNVRTIKSTPPLDRCFELPADLLFDTAQHVLSPAAVAKLESVIANMGQREGVAKLHVRGHSDARQLAGTALDRTLDNQKLSELRAESVAAVLQRVLKLAPDAVSSDGAGSREPHVKCEATKSSTRYELEQCTRPNRRVEIKVTLSSGKSGQDASPKPDAAPQAK